MSGDVEPRRSVGMGQHPAFWEDLDRDLEHPEFLAEYVAASEEIERIDAHYRRS